MNERGERVHSQPDNPNRAIAERKSSHSEFWDERYRENEHLFGTRPNAFIADQADRLPQAARTVEVGAGEGRTLIHLARRYDHDVTAVDFSPEALEDGRQLAAERGVELHTIEADVRTWSPDEQWDVVIATYVQLLPDERPAFFRLMSEIVRPGGWIMGEWFRPDHFTGDDYADVGPPRLDRMVALEELRTHFEQDEQLVCRQVDVELEEGPLLRGPSAVVRLVARKSSS